MNLNFWGYILAGLTSVFTTFFARWPASGASNEIFSSAPGMLINVILPGYFWTSPFVDLRIIGVVIGLVLFLETIRAVIAIWRWILTVIPAAS